MSTKGLFRFIAILCILSLLLTGLVWTIPAAADDSVPPASKVSSLLALRVQMKTGNQLLTDNLTEYETSGTSILSVNDLSISNSEKIFLRFADKPSSKQINDLASLGVKVFPDSWIPPVGDFSTGFVLADMPVDKLDALANKDYILNIDTAEEQSSPQNDLAREALNVDPVWTGWDTGAGVTVAVLDSGIDNSNPDFPALNPSNSKDYSAYPTLDDTITNNITGHGTHVTGSVLGRGVNSSTYKGVAPGANLVFLKIGNDSTGNASSAAEVAAIRAAVDVYHAKIITMSYGGWSQYHDGSEPICQTVDYAVSQGTTVFVSAGNNGASGWHYSGTVAAGKTTNYIPITLTDGSGYSTGLAFNLVWYDGLERHNSLNLKYYDYSQTELITVTSGSQSESVRGTEDFYSYYDYYVGSGTYYLKVQNTSNQSQTFHIYYDSRYNMSGASSVNFTNPDPNYTLCNPAEADGAIAVGAYVSRSNWTNYQGSPYSYDPIQTVGSIATYSSRGPRVDSGAPGKPEIVAPGSAIISVRDSLYTLGESYSPYIIDNDGNNSGSGPANYLVMQGTSMACPIAAGVGALLIAKDSSLTPAQVKHAFQSTATDKGASGFDNIYGSGLIDASAAVKSLVKIGFTNSPIAVTAGSASDQITIQSQLLSNDNAINVWENATINLTSTSGSGVFSSNQTPWVNITTVTIPAGDNNTSFYYKDTLSGSPTLTAAGSGFIGTQSNINVFPSTTAKFGVAGYPSSVTQNTSKTFSVIALDSFNNKTTNYTGTVFFSSSDSQATLPDNYTFTSSDSGAKTFSATLKTIGTQSLTATDNVTGSITGIQSGIVVKKKSGGGGGGGGGSSTPVGKVVVTDLFGSHPLLMIGNDNKTLDSLSCVSPDKMLTINISARTQILDSSGKLATTISYAVKQNPPALSSTFKMVGSAYEFGPDGTTFNPPLTFIYRYTHDQIPTNVNEADIGLAYYDNSAQTWIPVPGILNISLNTITTNISHFTTYAVIGPTASDISLSSLDISPAQALTGEKVNITLTFNNAGGKEGTYPFQLYINGVGEPKNSVTVSPGASQKVNFEVTKQIPGNYAITIEKLTGTFNVSEPPPVATAEPLTPAQSNIAPQNVTSSTTSNQNQNTSAQSTNWVLIGIVAAVVVIGIILLLVLGKRPKGKT